MFLFMLFCLINWQQYRINIISLTRLTLFFYLLINRIYFEYMALMIDFQYLKNIRKYTIIPSSILAILLNTYGY